MAAKVLQNIDINKPTFVYGLSAFMAVKDRGLRRKVLR